MTRADVLIEVVDASDPHAPEHRSTVQQVLDELGAGDKPRLVVYNKVDLIEDAARDAAIAAPIVGGAVFVSATTGFGIETLRTELSAVLASLWVDVDAVLPYSAGELLARVRERATVDLQYRDRDVRVVGRMSPAMAGEVEAVAERYAPSLVPASRDGAGPQAS